MEENDQQKPTVENRCTTQVISVNEDWNGEKDSGSQKENDQREPTAVNVSTTQVISFDEDCSVGNDESFSGKGNDGDHFLV